MPDGSGNLEVFREFVRELDWSVYLLTVVVLADPGGSAGFCRCPMASSRSSPA
jgi:hypothetical protein